MSNQPFQYTGTDNLEIMQEAKKYNKFLASLILKQNIPLSSRILDIGAGIGLFSNMIKEHGYQVDCLEIDQMQANILSENGFNTFMSIDDVPDNSFDVIYAFNVLEHIENDREMLKEWALKLKKGGIIILYVPAFNLLFSSMDKKVGHYRRYRRKELTNIVDNVGLLPLKSAKYADSLGFFVSLIYKLINKNDGSLNRKTLIFYDRIIFPLSRVGDVFMQRILGKNVYIFAKKF